MEEQHQGRRDRRPWRGFSSEQTGKIRDTIKSLITNDFSYLCGVKRTNYMHTCFFASRCSLKYQKLAPKKGNKPTNWYYKNQNHKIEYIYTKMLLLNLKKNLLLKLQLNQLDREVSYYFYLFRQLYHSPSQSLHLSNILTTLANYSSNLKIKKLNI